MKIHKLAKYFPILEGEEFDLLVEDIELNGQLEPIVLFDGKILDGVNRYRACEELDIDPITKEYDGDDPLAYVISANIRRRHLNTSQKAMLATEMLPEFEAESKERQRTNIGKGERITLGTEDPKVKKGKSRDNAGKVFGVSGASIQRAKRVKEEAPEKVDDIIKGKETVSSVDNELREKAAEKRNKNEQEKQDKKIPKEHPKAVKEFLNSITDFKTSIKFAIRTAKQGMFSPESKQFIQKQYGQIVELMNELIEEV